MIKKLLILLALLVTVGGAVGGVLFYNNYTSDKSTVSRLVQQFYVAEVKGDKATLKDISSASLRYDLINLTLSPDKNAQVPKLELVGTTVIKDSAGITGLIHEGKRSIPVVAKANRIDGSWRISLFNAGLITPDGN